MNKDTVRKTLDKRAAQISAYVVLDRKGGICAVIRIGHPKDGAGRLYVDVRHSRYGLRYVERAPHCAAKLPKGAHTTEAAHDLFGYQAGAAGSYKYNKKTAALAGLIVCGHTLADHCGDVPEDEAKRARLVKRYQREAAKNGGYILRERDDYWRDAAKRIGCSWSNWKDGRYNSLYFMPGLERLEALGFRVVQAV